MPFKSDIPVNRNSYTALSSGPVAAAFIQNTSGYDVTVQATAANTAPPITEPGGAQIPNGGAMYATDPLTAFFSAAGAGPYYLWVKGVSGTVKVDHA
jgi:hypothetical protein